MSPQLIYAVAGLALSVLTLSQVTPSLIGALDNKRAEVGQSKEEALAQHIAQYRSLEGQFPSTVTELINKGYWRAQDNDNGFGGGYTFSVDEAKRAREVFVTAASSFVMPIVSLDGTRIGDGKPGPVATRLREIYLEQARREAI